METKSVQRRFDLDWLRIFAILTVFLYHCGRFFNSGGWHIKNAETSAAADIFIRNLDLWNMPLIFLISGASIVFALKPGGIARFLRDRVLRLLVPLAFGILVLAPPQMYLDNLTHHQFQGSFFQYLPVYFAGNIAWSGVHLWYLEYLFLFTLVLFPLFLWLKRPSGERILAGLSRFTVRPGAIFLWVVPLALIVLLADPFGLRGEELPESILRLVVYPLVLVYGFLVFADEGIQQSILHQRRAALILSLTMTPALPLIILAITQWGWEPGLAGYLLIYTLAMLLSWSYLLTILGFGMRYLTANHPRLAYVNEAVLPFYMLHQPVILLIGYFVIPLALPILLKYLIIFPLAFGITIGLYEFAVRRFNVMRFLFGMKLLDKALIARFVDVKANKSI
jgi:peptidoglycan/LPS O-acetylase OafA/YrhL